MGVGAIERGDGRVLVGSQLARDLAGHKPAFFLSVASLEQADAPPKPALRPQGLAFAGRIVAHHRSRGVEDDLRGPVVLLQADDPGAGIIFLELQDVLDRGPAPAINRLVFIADHTKVLMIEGELADELVLGAIRVLVFVHQDVAKPLIVPPANVRGLVKERDCLEQQVVEVERIRLAKFPFVEVKYGCQLRPLSVGGVAVEFLRADASVLGVADLGERRARGRDQLGQPQLLEAGLDDALLVVPVVDREVAAVAEPVDVAAQDADAKGMERRNQRRTRQAHSTLGEERSHPLLHLVCRLVGEGHAENALGRHAAHLDQIGDAVRYHAGLAAARSGENQQGAVRLLDCATLLGIEVVKETGHVDWAGG